MDERSLLARKVDLLKQLNDRERFNQLALFDPYPYQKRFLDSSKICNQVLLMAGNRIGKSMCGSRYVAMVATGLYPKWFRGRTFKKPATIWVGGVSLETVRDICQAELLGAPGDPDAQGSGALPRDLIIKSERKPGVPNAVANVNVRHISGGTSQIFFKSYDSMDKWYGRSVDLVWLDEEPERDLYSQAMTRTLDRRGLVMMTFTPERGITETVASFMNNLQAGQSMTNAGWDDASEDVRTVVHKHRGHLTHQMMDQILSAYAPHEREMRRNGRPSIGTGLVFPVHESKLMVEPFEIPEDWPRIGGLDLGWSHPTAYVQAAFDPDAEESTVYIIDCYRQSKAPPHVHAAALKSRGDVPIAWPHDGHRRDSMGNPGLADQYRSLGLNMLPMHFENPPALGEKKGGNNVQQGIQHMVQAMEQDRFKVFNTLTDWWEEFRSYHYKDSKVVAIRDDLMSATRYAVMSERYAMPKNADGVWQRELDYPDYGIV